MDESEQDVLAYMTFPAQQRAKLHITIPFGTSQQGGMLLMLAECGGGSVPRGDQHV